jgi:hypothetical protein
MEVCRRRRLAAWKREVKTVLLQLWRVLGGVLRRVLVDATLTSTAALTSDATCPGGAFSATATTVLAAGTTNDFCAADGLATLAPVVAVPYVAGRVCADQLAVCVKGPALRLNTVAGFEIGAAATRLVAFEWGELAHCAEVVDARGTVYEVRAPVPAGGTLDASDLPLAALACVRSTCGSAAVAAVLTSPAAPRLGVARVGSIVATAGP